MGIMKLAWQRTQPIQVACLRISECDKVFLLNAGSSTLTTSDTNGRRIRKVNTNLGEAEELCKAALNKLPFFFKSQKKTGLQVLEILKAKYS